MALRQPPYRHIGRNFRVMQDRFGRQRNLMRDLCGGGSGSWPSYRDAGRIEVASSKRTV